MSDSILLSVKQVLGLEADDAAFDQDIILHINAAFSTLQQLGTGPVTGFAIDDATDMWVTFLGGDPKLNFVKQYMFLKVRLIFDPPTTSFLIAAFQKQVEELEWRLTVNYAEKTFVVPREQLFILDGGTP